VFDQSNYGYNGGTILGRNLLSAGMLDYVKNETVDSKQAQIIKKESVNNPNILLGWQVTMHYSIQYRICISFVNFLLLGLFRLNLYSIFVFRSKWTMAVTVHYLW